MFGKFGIFISWSIAITVPLFIGLFFLLPKSELGYRPAVTIDRKLIVDILHFSFSNYLGDLSWNAPTLILPIIVINTLGPAISAFFFIAWAIGSIINTIANMMSTSLFAEGSNNLNALEHNLGRSIKMILLLLIPIVAITVIFADKILVLDEGRLVAEGTHRELIVSSPLYRQIYESQLGEPTHVPGISSAS